MRTRRDIPLYSFRYHTGSVLENPQHLHRVLFEGCPPDGRQSRESGAEGGEPSIIGSTGSSPTRDFPRIGWEKRGSVVSSSSTSTEEGAIRVNSPLVEDNRNDSAYELIDMSEVSVGGSTGAGVHGAVGIAAGVAVTVS
ncbi:uncharacterized protein LOC119728701 [Patiria miniata]|uniref:Uncharacterized protein n=1 Tax=Patiria miniata TaxID=46514 RepID=A0A913ZZG1_PATMI|nr:uncharacterized protein LOC119728701 [Patiria miniata]